MIFFRRMKNIFADLCFVNDFINYHCSWIQINAWKIMKPSKYLIILELHYFIGEICVLLIIFFKKTRTIYLPTEDLTYLFCQPIKKYKHTHKILRKNEL
jgi:hypothetical protein